MSVRAGVDVGGTKVLAVLVDDASAVLARVRLASSPGADGVVRQVVAAVTAVCEQAGVDVDELTAVGIGVPGVVDPLGGTVRHAVNLGLVESVDLAGPVAAALGVPVRLENDLNAAATGAAAVLGLADRDLAFLAVGTGLAAGLLLDGTLRRGAGGAAGEVGHVTYRADGPRCACGQHGCLEEYASGRALEAAWAARPRGHEVAGPAVEGPPPRLLAAAAAAGEPWAVAAWGTFVDAVATAVQVLVLTCDVPHVVIGGGVAGLGEPLADAVRAALSERAAASPFLSSLQLAERVQLVPAGADPAAVGAALTTGEARRPAVVAREA
ncbi:MAG TPA: ROK family protein [Actinotalea sp.]|nr:ROK family protein [Actinotalea sp.]